MENLTFLDFCKEKLSPLPPTDLSDFTEFLQAHDLHENQSLSLLSLFYNIFNRENSPLVSQHYDQSTIETKEEDPTNDTHGVHDSQESAYSKRNLMTSVSKSYLPEVPLAQVPKMKSGSVEKNMHVFGTFNQDLGEIRAHKRARKMMRSIRCNCRKSQCKKNYCDCLAEGRYCGENCCCRDCKNVPGMKVESGKKRKREVSRDNSWSEGKGRELKGCNCKRSKCQKKYCDCFSIGVKCGEDCCCMNCKNKPGKVEKGPKKMLKLLSAEEKRVGVVERRDKGFCSVRKIVDWNQRTLSIYDSGVNFGLKLFTDHIDDNDGDELLL